ncbi:unnamed protein product [Pedinophyceae sp. YPF-701]|nr:unnamed protein product [Pedinophyceae sp. YPF-701]
MPSPLKPLPVASGHVRLQARPQGREAAPPAATLRRHAARIAVTAAAVGMLLIEPGAAYAAPSKDKDSGVAPEDSPLIQGLLQRSRDNKERYDAERLDAYTSKNFCDYFSFDAGNPAVARARGISKETYEKIKKYAEEHECPGWVEQKPGAARR